MDYIISILCHFFGYPQIEIMDMFIKLNICIYVWLILELAFGLIAKQFFQYGDLVACRFCILYDKVIKQ